VSSTFGVLFVATEVSVGFGSTGLFDQSVICSSTIGIILGISLPKK